MKNNTQALVLLAHGSRDASWRAPFEAIAAQVFVEMLEAGYASVGEFHYVHHQSGGAPYDDVAELSARIMAGAGAAGIGLTHLPVLYSCGGAGGQPLGGAGCCLPAQSPRRMGWQIAPRKE